MKIEDFKEIKNKHFKACEKIVAQDGSCDGVNCCDCPFDDSNAINGNTCNVNGYQTRNFRDKDSVKKEYSKEFLKFRDEGKMEKEKVLEVEFQDVFDRVAWRIAYQNEDVLSRDFEDREIGVKNVGAPFFDYNGLCLKGRNEEGDDRILLVDKEEAEIIQQRVDAINEKYGVPKRWRAKKGGRYFCIAGSGSIGCAVDYYIGVDDDRYKFGNYFKTKEEAQVKLDKIKSILQGE